MSWFFKRQNRLLSRRNFLSWSAAAGILAATNKMSGCSRPASEGLHLQENTSPPRDKAYNVLMFSIDDLRPQLGCYGHSQMITPNIDRLASESVSFKRAYCQIPICGASRVSLMTGLRPTYFRLTSFDSRKDQDLPDTVSLPAAFKDAGYTSISLGKIYHFSDDDNASWSKPAWRAKTERYLSPGNASFHPYPEDPARKGPAFEAADVFDDAYPDGQVALKAVETLQRLKQTDEPFFLGVGFNHTHFPLTAPQKYWDLYNLKDIQLSANPYMPKGAPAAAMHRWTGLRKFQNVPQWEEELPEDLARQIIHAYYATISYADALVGQVLAELTRLNLEQDTIVIFWGDHGFHLGDNGLWEKHTLYEKSLHVPLIVKVAGITQGQSSLALTEFVDVYPTLCELCQVPMPSNLEGISLVPLLQNPDHLGKKAAFSRYNNGKSIRTDRYRYTEFYSFPGPDDLAKRIGLVRVDSRMLYDHQVDPEETVNIADLPENQALVDNLHAKLRKGWPEFQT